LWRPVPDSINNLFELGYMLRGHPDASADHDAVEGLARKAVQYVVTQASVRSDREMLRFPTPLTHQLHVALYAIGHEILVQARRDSGIGEIDRVRRIPNH
jgi:hypothetical protein